MKSVLKFLYASLFRLLGWKFDVKKTQHGIYVVPTHTSLWDAPLGIGYVCESEINGFFLLTDIWYNKFPKLFKSLNFFSTPDMDSTSPAGYVSFFKKLKKEVKRQKSEVKGSMSLVICPEGQLPYCDHWKGSFLYLSKVLKLPLYIVKLDYRNKLATIANPDDPIPAYEMSQKEVMDQIREIVDVQWGKHPEQVGNIRLENEEQ